MPRDTECNFGDHCNEMYPVTVKQFFFCFHFSHFAILQNLTNFRLQSFLFTTTAMAIDMHDLAEAKPHRSS